MWRVGKTHAWTPEILWGRNTGSGCNRQWQSWIPKRVGTGLLRHSQLVEEIRWLAKVRPRQSQVYCEIWTQLVVIAHVQEGIVFLETEFRITFGDVNRGRNVTSERGQGINRSSTWQRANCSSSGV